MKKLHLGCLDRAVPGWINTDVTPHGFVARVPFAARLLRLAGLMSEARYQQHREGLFRDLVYLDMRRKFPFSDQTFDFVFSAHALEHLTPAHAQHCVREVYRVLRPGGLFRLSVPDLDRAVREFDPQEPEKLVELFFVPDQRRSKNQHHWMYNAVSMERLLRSAGFGEVARCEFRKGRCEDLELLDNREHESLFMEAVR